MTHRYDIIGDIHGYADELEALLTKLGYTETSGAFRHPEDRRAVFLGDYIDRGPKIARVLEIVRSMVDAGIAFAILGNHEVNALRYHTKDSDGYPLRPHTSKNRSKHQATLDQIAEPFPHQWRFWLDWFARLPLWLDLGGFRAVHASWDREAIAVLRDAGPLTGTTLKRFSVKGTSDHQAISRLVSGPKATVLNESTVSMIGSLRKRVRVQWWKTSSPDTAQAAVFPSSSFLPALQIVFPQVDGYEADAPPVFFGHYAVPVSESIVALNAACLDFGIAENGHIGAFRWDGERRLIAEKLIWQARIGT